MKCDRCGQRMKVTGEVDENWRFYKCSCGYEAAKHIRIMIWADWIMRRQAMSIEQLDKKIEQSISNFFQSSKNVDRKTYFSNLEFYRNQILAAIEEAGYICVGKENVRIPRWLYDAMRRDCKALKAMKRGGWKVTKAITPSIDFSKYGKVSDD